MKFLTTISLFILFSFSGKAQSSFFVDDAENVYKCGADWVNKYAPGSTEGIIVAGGNRQGGLDNQLRNIKLLRSEPILGQFLTAETIIDGNAPSINNQFQISPGSKFTQDKKGNIYVVETQKHRILRVSADGKSFVVVAGGNGPGANSKQLNNPQDIYIDDVENIYVVDTGNNRVQKFEKGNLDGITIAGGNGAGNNSNQLSNPTAIKADSKGNLFIADRNNNRIQKFELAEKKISIFAQDFSIFSYPEGIFLDKNDELFISVPSIEKIVKWNTESKKIIQYNVNGYVYSFLVDKLENIYYCLKC
jgi:hypothetical protein